jgi:phosphatidylglycerophosphate synthase
MASNLASRPTLHIAGENKTKIWGMSNAERLRRQAKQAGISIDDGTADQKIWTDQAFAFDPLWFRHVIANPGLVVTDNGRPALGHVDAGIAAQLDQGDVPKGLEIVEMKDEPSVYNDSLRKLQQPFCELLTPDSVSRIERDSYYGAYKGVTDILTKYLWPEIAYHLTRFAAALRMTPNMVTAIGAICCLLAMVFFWQGQYWTGTILGFVFMVLDTVDGKLARCTITSSWWGNIFDHGIDLIHPPFWWFAWGVGLGAWGLGYDSVTFWSVQAIILGGYIFQRLLEGWFIARFGIHMHVWRKFDSDFRLITARRNPNMVLLVVSLLFARPDLGLIAVAVWTVLSLLVHLWQSIAAQLQTSSGRPITSWLEETA